MSEAIYIVEYTSIPVGIDILDTMVKRAPVHIIYAQPVCFGKYLIVLGGDVEDVREAQKAVADAGESRLLQQYLLTNAHRQIMEYFKRERGRKPAKQDENAIGILETLDASTGFQSLDAALKGGNTSLEQVWIGHFIGGKFCYILSGQVGDIKTALSAGTYGIDKRRIASFRVIPSPDGAVLKHLYT